MLIPGIAIFSGYYYQSYPAFQSYSGGYLNGIPVGAALYYPIKDNSIILTSIIAYIIGINAEGFFNGQLSATFTLSKHVSVSPGATITIDSVYTTIGPAVSFDYTP
jgi:hypothetical protein